MKENFLDLDILRNSADNICILSPFACFPALFSFSHPWTGIFQIKKASEPFLQPECLKIELRLLTCPDTARHLLKGKVQT
ncbi:hypothetical protein D3Z50_12925 [Clostridiaceae bacterium]|nr:hypothetical protein [Clostridiaceae bacterium]